MSVTSSPLFTRGDRVRLKSNPALRGAVVDGPRKHVNGFEYAVLIEDTEEWLSERKLEAVPVRNRPRWVSRDDLVLQLALAKLRHPLTDALYAYRASRTLYEPYQFRSALKFLRNPNQRILIADEVGLGKTIEAAIIYLELKARLDISRVLVLCPSRLKEKWRDELSNRFEEEFEILDAPRLRRMLDDLHRLGSSPPLRAIASFEMMRRSEFLDLVAAQQLPLDLLIVDEAHYMRNEGAATYRLGAALTNTAEAAIFLTATPLHLRNRDLYNLLNLLSPEEFSNPDLFEEQVRPNEFINRAIRLTAAGQPRQALFELKNVEQSVLRDRFLRNPYYKETVERLTHVDKTTSLSERVAVQWELMELNTLSSIFSRTRKREVTHGAVRAPFTVRVALTPAERRLYEAVLQRARAEIRLTGPGATGFAAIMKERQAASCLPAMRNKLAEAAAARSTFQLDLELSAYDLDESDEVESAPAPRSLVELSRNLGDVDSKFDQFAEILKGTLAEDPTSKALIFSFFRGTLEYLHQRLSNLGYNAGVIHGKVPLSDRRRIIEEFRCEPDQRILLSSEVGAEGLDFQFCDILVNYDLPWNPMQVEQRIGRLDRFGQEHERIRIYNFYIEDTIETRIFQRLYDRIQLFEHSIGDLEAILGEEISKLSREAIQREVTPDEEARLADEAALRIERRQLEEAQLEQHKDELLGQGEIFDAQIKETIGSGRIVVADEVRALVGTFLRRAFPRSRIIFDEDEPCATIDIDRTLADHLRRLGERMRISHQFSQSFRAALNERRRLPFTFDADYARQRPMLEFVTARHPLAVAALEHWSSQMDSGYPAAKIAVPGCVAEAGTGYFFIYLLNMRAATQRITLETVVVLDDGEIPPKTAKYLLRAIQDGTAAPCSLSHDEDALALAERKAISAMATKRDTIEEEVRRRNEAHLATRTASVRASFDAKMHRVEELLAETTNDNIRRLRKGQLQNLHASLANKLEDLQRGKEVVVSSSLIAGGRIQINPDPRFESMKSN
jgi:superfamily II DNA or RNA helicase